MDADDELAELFGAKRGRGRGGGGPGGIGAGGVPGLPSQGTLGGSASSRRSSAPGAPPPVPPVSPVIAALTAKAKQVLASASHAGATSSGAVRFDLGERARDAAGPGARRATISGMGGGGGGRDSGSAVSGASARAGLPFARSRAVASRSPPPDADDLDRDRGSAPASYRPSSGAPAPKPILKHAGRASGAAPPAHRVDPTTQPANEITLKVLLVGDDGVGKTCLMRRYAQLPHVRAYTRTMGVGLLVVPLGAVGPAGQAVNVHFWDVPHAELRGRASHLDVMLEDADGVILMFDATRASTLAAIDQWRDVLATRRSADSLPLFLAGNKADAARRLLSRAMEYHDGASSDSTTSDSETDSEDDIADEQAAAAAAAAAAAVAVNAAAGTPSGDGVRGSGRGAATGDRAAAVRTVPAHPFAHLRYPCGLTSSDMRDYAAACGYQGWSWTNCTSGMSVRDVVNALIEDMLDRVPEDALTDSDGGAGAFGDARHHGGGGSVGGGSGDSIDRSEAAKGERRGITFSEDTIDSPSDDAEVLVKASHGRSGSVTIADAGSSDDSDSSSDYFTSLDGATKLDGRATSSPMKARDGLSPRRAHARTSSGGSDDIRSDGSGGRGRSGRHSRQTGDAAVPLASPLPVVVPLVDESSSDMGVHPESYRPHPPFPPPFVPTAGPGVVTTTARPAWIYTRSGMADPGDTRPGLDTSSRGGDEVEPVDMSALGDAARVLGELSASLDAQVRDSLDGVAAAVSADGSSGSHAAAAASAAAGAAGVSGAEAAAAAKDRADRVHSLATELGRKSAAQHGAVMADLGVIKAQAAAVDAADSGEREYSSLSADEASKGRQWRARCELLRRRLIVAYDAWDKILRNLVSKHACARECVATMIQSEPRLLLRSLDKVVTFDSRCRRFDSHSCCFCWQWLTLTTYRPVRLSFA